MNNNQPTCVRTRFLRDQLQGVNPRFNWSCCIQEPDANAWRLMGNAQPDANAWRLIWGPNFGEFGYVEI